MTTVNANTLIEIGLGSEDKVSVDDFFRIYAADNHSRIKGMIQIQEVIGPHQSIARQAWLHPSAAHITSGDVAKLISLVDELSPGNQLIQDIERKQAELAQQQETDDQRHQALRQQYQGQLLDLDQSPDHVTDLEQRFIRREIELQQRTPGYRTPTSCSSSRVSGATRPTQPRCHVATQR